MQRNVHHGLLACQREPGRRERPIRRRRGRGGRSGRRLPPSHRYELTGLGGNHERLPLTPKTALVDSEPQCSTHLRRTHGRPRTESLQPCPSGSAVSLRRRPDLSPQHHLGSPRPLLRVHVRCGPGRAGCCSPTHPVSVRPRIRAEGTGPRPYASKCGCACERCCPRICRDGSTIFTATQMVGLRFASDGELPELARKVLDENITAATPIKKLGQGLAGRLLPRVAAPPAALDRTGGNQRATHGRSSPS